MISKFSSSKILSTGVEGAKGIYENLDKLLWITVPTAIGGITWAGLKAMEPEAVSDNLDKVILNETLKSSLAESVRKYEQRQREKEAADAYSGIRKHDRFL